MQMGLDVGLHKVMVLSFKHKIGNVCVCVYVCVL